MPRWEVRIWIEHAPMLESAAVVVCIKRRRRFLALLEAALVGYHGGTYTSCKLTRYHKISLVVKANPADDKVKEKLLQIVGKW